MEPSDATVSSRSRGEALRRPRTDSNNSIVSPPFIQATPAVKSNHPLIIDLTQDDPSDRYDPRPELIMPDVMLLPTGTPRTTTTTTKAAARHSFGGFHGLASPPPSDRNFGVMSRYGGTSLPPPPPLDPSHHTPQVRSRIRMMNDESHISPPAACASVPYFVESNQIVRRATVDESSSSSVGITYCRQLRSPELLEANNAFQHYSSYQVQSSSRLPVPFLPYEHRTDSLSRSVETRCARSSSSNSDMSSGTIDSTCELEDGSSSSESETDAVGCSEKDLDDSPASSRQSRSSGFCIDLIGQSATESLLDRILGPIARIPDSSLSALVLHECWTLQRALGSDFPASLKRIAFFNVQLGPPPQLQPRLTPAFWVDRSKIRGGGKYNKLEVSGRCLFGIRASLHYPTAALVYRRRPRSDTSIMSREKKRRRQEAALRDSIKPPCRNCGSPQCPSNRGYRCSVLRCEICGFRNHGPSHYCGNGNFALWDITYLEPYKQVYARSIEAPPKFHSSEGTSLQRRSST